VVNCCLLSRWLQIGESADIFLLNRATLSLLVPVSSLPAIDYFSLLATLAVIFTIPSLQIEDMNRIERQNMLCLEWKNNNGHHNAFTQTQKTPTHNKIDKRRVMSLNGFSISPHLPNERKQIMRSHAHIPSATSPHRTSNASGFKPPAHTSPGEIPCKYLAASAS
jgi:hypothetical protein